jgi:hypothetical protein
MLHTQDVLADTWVATDDEERFTGIGDGDLDDKKVGIFYFLWDDVQRHKGDGKIYNHTDAYARGGVEGLIQVMQQGPVGFAHYWAEPYFGYYRSDDADYITSFYYLPDGATSLAQAQTLKLGTDGCFGSGDSGSQNMEVTKGYFAFPLEYFLMGSTKLTKDTPITGLYFYASLKNNSKYFNVPYFFDDARLVVDVNNLLG